jgi:hypothetical protein
VLLVVAQRRGRRSCYRVRAWRPSPRTCRRGRGQQDALALADAIEFLGAEVRTSSNWDYSTVALSVPVARLTPALGLMADVALRADFRRGAGAAAQACLDRAPAGARGAGTAGLHAMAQALFPGHRHGPPAGGTAASLTALTPETCARSTRSTTGPATRRWWWWASDVVTRCRCWSARSEAGPAGQRPPSASRRRRR